VEGGPVDSDDPLFFGDALFASGDGPNEEDLDGVLYDEIE
jgi:hypothetical protein